ncbi:MAG: hypothetical protein LBG97_07260 [Coriobacteriales bacterium]|jgi:hypothetical protein|nr:hypothetical protein [Coriobacteriales bacterium]
MSLQEEEHSECKEETSQILQPQPEIKRDIPDKDQLASERKKLNKLKRDAKRARKAEVKEAERKAAQDAANKRKEAKRQRDEAMKVTVVDGYVVDNLGNRLRPYSKAEWFFDNKPLCYGVLVLFFLACIAFIFLNWSAGTGNS